MKLFGCNCRLECLLVAVVLGFLMGSHLLASSMTREGFSALDYVMNNGVHSKSYKKVDLPYEKVMGPTVPLPEGQMFFWAQNEFKPECCKWSPVSGSKGGCACPTKEQIQFLRSKGGNSTYSTQY